MSNRALDLFLCIFTKRNTDIDFVFVWIIHVEAFYSLCNKCYQPEVASKGLGCCSCITVSFTSCSMNVASQGLHLCNGILITSSNGQEVRMLALDWEAP